MALFLATAPTTEPLTLAQAKLHLRIDTATTDEDALVTALIEAARQTVETYTHRAIPVQTWDLKLDSFFDRDYYENGAIWLPKPPVSSVTSVTYLDGAGTSQTWATTTGYLTDLPTGPWARRARIYPAYAVQYPATYGVPNAVTIRFVAGSASAPEAVKAAMKLLIGHWYQNREAAVVATIAQDLPQAVASLLWPLKAF